MATAAPRPASPFCSNYEPNTESLWWSSGTTARRMVGMLCGHICEHLTSGIHLVRLPAYSPDYNADEAIWAWARAEVTANTCLGTKAAVRERVDVFFVSLHQRKEAVKRR